MSTKPSAAVSIRRGKTLRAVCLVVLAAVVIAIPIFSQSPAGVKPSFEVASIKPGDPGQRGSSIMNQPGGRLVTRGMPLRALITFAYRVRDFQIIGGPAWLTTDRWDIEARAEEGSISQPAGPPDPNTPDPMAIRLQSLLEEPVPAEDASRYPGIADLRTLGRQRRIQGKAVGGSIAVSTSGAGHPGAAPAATGWSHATLQHESRPGQSRSSIDGYIQRRADAGVRTGTDSGRIRPA